MPVSSRRWLTGVLYGSLAFVAGCQKNSDNGYHTYKETAASPPVAPVVTDSEPLKAGSVPPKTPVAEVPVAAPVIATVEPTPARIPSQPVPVTNAEPETSRPTEVMELALSIPPEPPTPVTLASLSNPTTPAPVARKMELLIPEKDFQVEGPEGAIRVSFDDIDLLKVLNADPVPPDVEQHLPAWLSGLNGKRVRIRGWMFPPTQETDLPAFMFVRDNQICCFGRKPMVYDKFGVRMREGETTSYIFGHPFDVIGRMVVKSRMQGDELFWLYMIEDAIVIDE